MPHPRYLTDLLGVCLWDILADNNDLRLPSGDIAHPGSFRMVGGMIADHDQNKNPGPPHYSYMDFYMGASALTDRADLTTVYQLLFHRLKAAQYDWIYEHTALGIVSFAKPPDPSLENYKPSEAIAQQQEEKAKAAKLEKLQAKLAKIARQEKLAARKSPTSQIIQAYQNIFQKLPSGWPPDPYQSKETPS